MSTEKKVLFVLVLVLLVDVYNGYTTRKILRKG